MPSSLKGGRAGCPCSTNCCLRTEAPRVPAEAILAAGNKFVEVDGRKIEYSVGGDTTSDEIVYYQHGYLGSATFGGPFAAIAKELGLKLICGSQPGFGLRDSYPLNRKRTLAEWPRDVTAILDAENVKSCHLIGTSAGCVHTAALAVGLPAERIRSVLLKPPTAPDDMKEADGSAVTNGIAAATLFLKSFMSVPYVGDCIAFTLTKQSAKQRLAVAPDCHTAMNHAETEFPEAHDALLEHFEHGTGFTYRGIVDNFWAISEHLPWLGGLGALTSSGDHAFGITTAADDTTHPPVMQRWFQEQVPGSTMLHFAEKWGHLHIMPPQNWRLCLMFLKEGKDVSPYTPGVVQRP